MNHLNETPLGKTSEYVDQYTPSLLFPVPRQAARETLALEPGRCRFTASMSGMPTSCPG